VNTHKTFGDAARVSSFKTAKSLNLFSKFGASLLLATALVPALSACEGETAETRVGISFFGYEPPVGERGMPSGLRGDGPANELEIQLVDLDDLASGGSGGKSRIRTLDLAAGGGAFEALPFGTRFRLHVRGFDRNDPNNQPHMYGASVEFDVQPGEDAAVSFQVGPADCVTLNQASRVTRLAEGNDDVWQQRAGGTATQLPDGRVVLIGGGTVDGAGNPGLVTDTIEVYEPRSHQFVQLNTRLDLPRAWHSATLLDDRNILVVGGYTGAGSPAPVTNSAVIVNIDAINPVQAVGVALPAGEDRARHAAVRLGDGTVLLAGGYGSTGGPLATAWRFRTAGDPAAGQFVRQGDLRHARAFHTVSPLARGLELAAVAGGLGVDGPLDAIEVYTVNPSQTGCAGGIANPTAEVGCFIQTGVVRLAEARWGHRTVQVEGGKVTAFVGGYTNVERTSYALGIERLSDQLIIAAGAAGTVGVLANGVGEPAITALHDDSILILGGRRGADAVAGVWRLAPRLVDDGAGGRKFDGYSVVTLRDGCEMSEPRYDHFALRRPDSGLVLVVGGILGQAGNLAASRRGELYFPRVADVRDLYR
jgi:hypothetical protein